MLARLLIRFRWALLVLAVFAALALPTSLWCNVWASAPIGLLGGRARVGLSAGTLSVWWSHKVWSSEPLLSGAAHGRVSVNWWFQRWGADAVGEWGIGVPLWVLALLFCIPGFAGFVARRRLPVPGSCWACRYPLQGASICPECGWTAPSN